MRSSAVLHSFTPVNSRLLVHPPFRLLGLPSRNRLLYWGSSEKNTFFLGNYFLLTYFQKQSGHALGEASKELRADRDLVLAALPPEPPPGRCAFSRSTAPPQFLVC